MVVLFVLSFLVSSSTAKARKTLQAQGLIDKICYPCYYRDFCYDVVRSTPNALQATIRDIGVHVSDLAMKEADVTKLRLFDMSFLILEPYLTQLYLMCYDDYSKVVSGFNYIKRVINDNTYRSQVVIESIQATMNYADHCQRELTKAHSQSALPLGDSVFHIRRFYNVLMHIEFNLPPKILM
ncbi:hypothetical protein ACFE04_016149 [Oxalis oulophora]